MIREAIFGEIQKVEGEEIAFSVDAQEIAKFGEYSSNVALVLGKALGKNPGEVAEELEEKLSNSTTLEKFVTKIEIAGAGFLNFYLKRNIFSENIAKILKEKENFGKNSSLAGKKVILDYTDPNPFKIVHIGHMMTNAIGESLARIFEFAEAEVRRANYQGDVGLHVAKAIWHFLKQGGKDVESLASGEDYAQGNIAYGEDPCAKEEIEAINKKIYDRSDGEINKAYDAGRERSLEAFGEIYKILGTKFDFYFFESEVSELGQKAVEDGLAGGIFEKSDGAVVFRGEKYGLHTRVFINSLGLPTYEAKEFGLARAKYEKFPYDLSFAVSANEVADYFRVTLKAMSLLYPELAEKTFHVSHGILRLPEGKMSSRTGKVISFRELFDQVMQLILPKMGDVEDVASTAEKISIAALKYPILKQGVGKDVIFDFKTALSFEGDSGPYLQYTYARCRSVLRKAEEKGIKASPEKASEKVEEVERMLLWFSEVVLRAAAEREPHHIAVYLIKLAKAFNNFYARERIIGADNAVQKLALTEAVSLILKNGLWLLGIAAPEKM